VLRLLAIELTDRLTVIFANRVEKVKFMYRLAAATYGTLSERISSFVPFEWKLDAYEKYSGHDGSAEGFEKAVKELSVAYTTFCELCTLFCGKLLIAIQVNMNCCQKMEFSISLSRSLVGRSEEPESG
jgi:hypothetical protein